MFSRYIPPLLWGKSGHLQTALYGKLGRVSAPHPSGVRKYLPMLDGATATFDLFEPIGDHRTGGNIFIHRILLLLCTLYLFYCATTNATELSNHKQYASLNIYERCNSSLLFK